MDKRETRSKYYIIQFNYMVNVFVYPHKAISLIKPHLISRIHDKWAKSEARKWAELIEKKEHDPTQMLRNVLV